MRTLKTLKVLQKPRYVRGLRSILYGEKPCGNCPIGLVLEVDGFHSMYPCGRGSRGNLLCYDFIGRDVPGKEELLCPCMNFGKEALTLARAAIVAWDKGRHPWQKGKK